MTLKPGTLCLIISALDESLIGNQCTVKASPAMLVGRRPDGTVQEPTLLVRVTLADGEKRLFPPHCLVPINPDPDDDYIKREKDKPIEEVKDREKVYVE